MLFSSVTFLFLFLPLTLLFYFGAPALYRAFGGQNEKGLFAFRNVVLLFFSLLFYGWGEPLYVFLMVATIAADFLFGLWLTRAKSPKTVLFLAVFFNLSLLFFFKYASFVGGWFGLSLPMKTRICFIQILI